MMIFTMKAILIGLWLLAGAAFIAPDQMIYPDAFKIVGAVFIIVHPIEIFLFKKWHLCPEDYAHSFVFGLLNIKLLQNRAKAQNGQGRRKPW